MLSAQAWAWLGQHTKLTEAPHNLGQIRRQRGDLYEQSLGAIVERILIDAACGAIKDLAFDSFRRCAGLSASFRYRASDRANTRQKSEALRSR